ncbi:MAG: 4-hydroxybenzoyl-CoA thioesterase [Phycisphaeraceae bacterium]|nr:4-hydroxybenzoyl-CoA thioesterase [Phycisphaeraceae bacterium]
MADAFIYRRRVQFAETDLAGIVHFSRFFLYMEEAEHACLRSLGLCVHTKTPDAVISFPRVGAQCDYRQALRFEDEFEVHVSVAERKAKSISWSFTFHLPGAEAPLATGSITTLCVRMGKGADAMQATDIPPQITGKLDALTD